MTHPTRLDAFTFPIRIYYEDTDAGGVVYYANYLKFFERCRTEWLRAIGHQQSVLLSGNGIAFVVRNVNLTFLKPARLDDLLQAELVVERISYAQIFFRQRLLRANPGVAAGCETLVEGTIQVVCVDAAQMKAIAIPPFLRTQLEARQ